MNIKRIVSIFLLVTSSLFTFATSQASSLTTNSQIAKVDTSPSASSIRIVPGFEEPFVATNTTSLEEDQLLTEAIHNYGRNKTPDFTAFDHLLTTYPDTGWRAAILTNLGLAYYNQGYFSKAINAWEGAFEAGASATQPKVKAMVDRALGELLRMHARIGHVERVAELLALADKRALSGPATEASDGAKQGLWKMRNEPGVAYLCGPMALKNLLLTAGATTDSIKFIDDYRSGPQGVSLTEVGYLANKAKLSYRIAYRNQNTEIPLPAVVHWKIHHFAAIVGKQGDYYHPKDPTFGNDLWITEDALNSETSGYFLLPTTKLAEGFRDVSSSEADQVRGMGYTGTNLASATTPQDDKAKPGDCNHGMCGYNFSEMTVSLNLNDTPVGYRPPKGPAAFVTLTYNQREASQPANFSFFNVSPKWTLNWLSYIQDDPNVSGADVLRYVAGGGSVTYTGFNGSSYKTERTDGAILVKTSSNPIRYERRLANGAVEVYAQSNNAASFPRLIFLTQMIDASGNAMRLNYDAQMRLTSLLDATGRSTTFSYQQAGWPLLVTAITDPFGRSAKLQYDSNGRLVAITDVLGLTSKMNYNANALIDTLTTPYGTTRFTFGENGTQRFIEATDPLGYTERLEYRQEAPGIPYSDPGELVPQGIVAPFNIFLNGRNTFYWDKHAYRQVAGDYTKARIKHWTHSDTNINVTSNTIESIKYPFESRIWFNYPGQPNNGLGTAVIGSLDKPNRRARILDDGSTQMTQYSYNDLGNLISMTDPVGRNTQLTYAANQIDLTAIQQQTSNGMTTIGQFTYDSQHRPLSYTDAAGQVTRYTYNNAGRLLSVTNALNQTTRYEYNSLGYLTKTTLPNGKIGEQLFYDAFGRIATRKDSEGYVLRYSYDAFDRVTKTTFPDGTTETRTYDRLDLVTTTDRQGRTTRYEYDANRQRTAVIDPQGRRTGFEYLPNGELATLIDANGHRTSWQRDIQGRMTAKLFADNSRINYAYEDRTSRLKSETDAMGQSKLFSYAQDDRPSRMQYTNAVNATPNVELIYDRYFPRVASMNDGNGRTDYRYYDPGTLGALQLATEDGPFNNDTLSYTYDALGRVNGQAVNSSLESFAYDILGRMTGHNNVLGNFSMTYLGQTNQLTSRARNNQLRTVWTYDDNQHDRHLKKIDHIGSARDYTYEISPMGLIESIKESSNGTPLWPVKSWGYAYDDADRLISASASGGNGKDYHEDDQRHHDNDHDRQAHAYGVTHAPGNAYAYGVDRFNAFFHWMKKGRKNDHGLNYTLDNADNITQITGPNNKPLTTCLTRSPVPTISAINMTRMVTCLRMMYIPINGMPRIG